MSRATASNVVQSPSTPESPKHPKVGLNDPSIIETLPEFTDACDRVLQQVWACASSTGYTRFDLLYPADGQPLTPDLCEEVRWKFPIKGEAESWLLPHAICGWHNAHRLREFVREEIPVTTYAHHYAMYLALCECRSSAARFLLKHRLPVTRSVRLINRTWIGPRNKSMARQIEESLATTGTATVDALLKAVAACPSEFWKPAA